MITPITMFCANCDGCNRQWDNGHDGWTAYLDSQHVREGLDDSDWQHNEEVPGTWYCPDCYSIDDNDVITFKMGENG